MIKQFASFYFPGTHGSWLVWFINQHKNFPKEELHFLQTYYEGDDTGHDYTERGGGRVICNGYNDYEYHYSKDENGNEIPITDFTCPSSDWYYFYHSFNRKMEQTFDYESGATKNAFKVLDHHFPIWGPPPINGVDNYSNEPHEDGVNNQRKVLAQLVSESNVSGIILALVKDTFKEQLVGRFDIIRTETSSIELEINEDMIRDLQLPLITKNKSRRISKMYDIPNLTFGEAAGVPILYVDIGKLITCDKEEYNRLLDFIGEEEIPCWKDLINNTVMKVYRFNKLL